MVQFALSTHRAVQVQQVGVMVAGLGAISLILAGVLGKQLAIGRSEGTTIIERMVLAVGGVLLAVGFLIELIGLLGYR